jgi:regulator of protease activity HflC (stomatin/prohibitin superfamily)
MEQNVEKYLPYKKTTYLFIFLILLIQFVFGTKKIALNEVGVKTNLFSIYPFIKRGVSREIITPGFTFFIPYIQRVDKIDASILRYEMSDSFMGLPFWGSDPLEVRTFDESTVRVNVTVLYQIDKKLASEFLINIRRDRKNPDYYKKEMNKLMEYELKDELNLTLGKLSREEFYSNSTRRDELAREAKDKINNKFKQDNLGIFINDILIGNFFYDKEYEDKILEKNILEEETLVYEEKTKSSNLQASLETEVVSKANAQINLINEEAISEERKIKVNADLHKEKKIQEGDLLIRTAEATGKARLAEAFSGIKGRKAVAMEMVKALSGLDLIIIETGGKEGINPFDVKKMLDMYNIPVE